MLSLDQLNALINPYIDEVAALCDMASEMAAHLGTVNEPILHDYLRDKCGADGDALADKLAKRWTEKCRRETPQ